MVHLKAKYTIDNKLSSSGNQQCVGMNVVQLTFEEEDNFQSEKFKAMIKAFKDPRSPFSIELIGILMVDSDDPKFLVKEIIGISRSN